MASITITYGATSVQLDYVKPETSFPDQQKNFTEHTIENNSKVFDDAGTPKKRWELQHDVPLSGADKSALDTLYGINDTITLIENFNESNVAYSVHFENIKKSRGYGDTHYSLTFQEL